MNQKTGTAYLIGTGPGDLGLVTLRARQLIESCEVVIYDYLCNPEILRWTKPGAEIIYVGKKAGAHTLPQDQINALIVRRTQAGQHVARLKGGDPFVFGRGGEEAQELVRAGLTFEVVPGVSSAIAAPAYAGIPVTHRDYTSSVTFLTGHEDPLKETSALEWRRLASESGTRVILMGVERLRLICEQLLEHGAEVTTPCALIRWGTYPRQMTVEGTLGTIAALAEARGLKAPAIFIIGEVVQLRAELNWFEQRPLFGQRIVVTRTRTQASALTAKLQLLGADVLEIPTIRIIPRPWTETYPIADIANRFDWLIFTSPNAVEIFFDQFISLFGDVRRLGAIKIAAVGPATSAKIRAHHLKVDKQPTQFTTADLAQAFLPSEIAGQRFCLAHGNRSDPLLLNYLQCAQGHVEEWIIYDTVAETEDLTGSRARFMEEGADWIAFTSGSTAEHWHELHLSPPSSGRMVRHVSIGPVTSRAMSRLGLTIDLEASPHTIDGLINALLHATTHAK